MKGMLRAFSGEDEQQGPWGIDKMRQRLSKLGGGMGMLAGGEDHLQGDKSRYAQYAAGATRNFNPQNVGAGLNQMGHNIANGMLAGREMDRMNRTAGQEKAAWGMLGDPTAMLKSAPIGGKAHNYALGQQEQASAREAQQNDPAYRAKLRNMQLRNDKLESGGDQFSTVDVNGVSMQKGPDGRMYAMPSAPKPVVDKKLVAEQRAKEQATSNIGNMIDRLGQVSDGKTYTPHEVESSIGNWQGDDDSWVIGPLSRAGGWLTTLGSEHAPRDIRARIQGDALALSAAVKKISRGGGEGVFTDADQRVLERQIGDLTKASNIENYKQRLDDLKQRINGAYGLSIGQQGQRSNASDPLSAAKAAIAHGADPAAVAQRLQENGIDPAGLQ